MKKSILLFTCMFLCLCFSRAQEIATFEEPDLDIFNQLNEFVEIVENPNKSGVNTTDYCLMHFNPGTNDWSQEVGALLYDPILGERIVVSESNRYLHIMVYCEVADNGRIHFCVNPEEDQWNGGNNQENHFNFVGGKWIDIVFDLKNYTQIYGLFFLSQHWQPIGADRTFYYDEIIVNDDPNPRTVIEEGMVADFEENGITPNYYVEGSDGSSTLTVVTNPDTNGINETSNSLYFKQNGEGTEWTRAVIELNEPLVVNNTNRYMHVMIRMDIDQIDIGFMEEGGDYTWPHGRYINRKKNQWVDVVRDVSEYNVITAIAFSEYDIQTSNVYIDEIIFNDDPYPRGVNVVSTAVTIADFESDGITPEFIVEGTNGVSTATIVANPDKWGLNETSTALLFKQQGETNDWTRVLIMFDDIVKITDENCYMHVMVNSTVDKLEAVFLDYDEDWKEPEGGLLTTGEWIDFVVDVSDYKDKDLTMVGFCSWGVGISEIYIDEIIFNNDPSPRVELPYDKATTVADFEPDGVTPDYYLEEANNSTLEVVDNPDMTKILWGRITIFSGIDKTENCLYFNQVNEDNPSARACIEFKKPVQINSSNRYMHVMVRMDIDQIDIAVMEEGADEYQWPYNSRHVNTAVNEWIDVVRDLSEFDVVTGVAFSEWGTENSNIYIDEIIFNDDPTPREASFVDTAVTIADFETDGITPEFIVEHSEGSSVAELVDNPDTEGINTTSTSLLFTQTEESVDWTWVKIKFEEAVKITDENRYLHVMVRTDAPKLSVIFYDYGNEDWIDHEDLTNGEWIDLVTDLSEYKGKVLTQVGFCSYGVGTSEIYIDEVILNSSSRPRGRVVYIDEATTAADFEPDGITPDFFTEGGGNSTVTLVANPDKSGVNETEICLFFQQTNETTDWTRACVEFDNPIIINSSNCYMHVMIRMDISQIDIGIMEEGDEEHTWPYDRYKNQATNQWVDVVRDVSKFNIVTGVAFSEWGIGNSNVYIDEIIFNDDPNPRGADIITTAVTIADFETVNPDWYVEGTDGSSTAMIVANPDKEGLNDTDYALFFKQEGETIEWTRVVITFDNLVKITDENCYMHAMVKTNVNALSTIYFEPEETWLDHEDLTTGEWIDIVTDMTEFKGQNLSTVGFCSWGVVNSEIYIDEVVFNSDSKPREKEITGVEEVKYTTYYVSGETVYLQTVIDETIEVYDVTGKLYKKVISTGNVSFSLDKGIYIIKVGNETIKVAL